MTPPIFFFPSKLKSWLNMPLFKLFLQHFLNKASPGCLVKTGAASSDVVLPLAWLEGPSRSYVAKRLSKGLTWPSPRAPHQARCKSSIPRIPYPSQMICPMVAEHCTVHQDKGCCRVVFRDALVQPCSAATSIPGHQLTVCLLGGGCSWGRCSQCHALQRCACSLHPAKKWIS